MIDSHSGQESSTRAAPLPLPDNIRSVQPGGGVCLSRRTGLGTLAALVAADLSAGLRAGDGPAAAGQRRRCAHEIIDPRDLKYCRNVCDYSWDEADDPFNWRRSLPLARWGAGGTGSDGRASVGIDRPGRDITLVVLGLAARRVAGIDTLFLPQSAAACAAGAGPVDLAGRRHGRGSHAAGTRRIHRRAGGADRHLPVDSQRTLESSARPPRG